MSKKARRGPTRDLTMRQLASRSQLPVDPSTGMVDYNKIKVGVKVLEDAVIDTPLKKVRPNFSSKRGCRDLCNSPFIHLVSLSI